MGQYFLVEFRFWGELRQMLVFTESFDDACGKIKKEYPDAASFLDLSLQ